jgi:ketosteroid isomerase-like protein
MDQEKQTGEPTTSPPAKPGEQAAREPIDDAFFRRLHSELQNPQPSEAVAAAVQAVQRLTLQMDSDAAELDGAHSCPTCGSANPAENRFCATCGVPLADAAARESELPAGTVPGKPPARAAGSHHYHHHYHHHYFSSFDGAAPVAAADQRATVNPPVIRDAARRAAPAGAPLGRAETAVRKLTQDWALACNTKHLDDLVSLYTADAIVLRPNVPPVRGAAAIREFFFSVLDAGLGEVEMEALRTEVFGEIAYEAGRCQMLVPVAVNKRREERGKYMTLLARQSGEWKIIADCWSSDLSLGVSAEPPPAKSGTPTSPVLRPNRKGA